MFYKRISLALVLLFFAGAGWTLAQETFNDIYIDNDAEITEAFSKADKLIQKKDYDTAFLILKIIFKQDKLVSTCVEDSADKALNYGVRERAKTMLLHLPVECKVTAIQEHDALAAHYLQLYAKNHEEELLVKILNEAFLSSKTEEALTMLAESYLEKGSPRQALTVLNKYLVQRGLTPNAKISCLLFMAGAMSNKYDVALEKKIREEFKDHKINLQGREISGVELVETVRGQFKPAAAEKSFGANLTPKWSVKLPNLNYTMSRSVLPFPLKGFASVYEDSVFVNVGTSVKRFNLKTGEPIGKDYALAENPQFQSVTYPLSVKTCLAVNGVLYANLIANNAGEVQHNQMSVARTDFAAFNISDGKLLWTLSSGNEGSQKFLETYANSIINSPPTYNDGKLILEMVVLRGSADSHLLVVDAATGKVNWNTFICSKSQSIKMKPMGHGIGGRGLDRSMTVLRTFRSVLCLGDEVYFANAYGAMGAMNLLNGNLMWIRKFNPLQIEMGGRGMGAMGGGGMGAMGSTRTLSMVPGKNDLGWISNQPLKLNDNTVIFTPQRNSEIHFLQRFEGKYNVDKLSYSKDVRQVLGLIDGKLYFYDDKVTVIDTNSNNAAEIWGNYGEVSGQGAIAHGCVFLPLESCIAVISIDKKRIIGLVELKDTTQGANISVNDKMLLACSADQLNVFEITPFTKPIEDVPYGKFVPVAENTPKQNYFAELIHRLGNPDVVTRQKSFEELIRWCPESFDSLLKATKHPNPEVRVHVVNVLKKARFVPMEVIEKVFAENFPQFANKNMMIQMSASANIGKLGVGILPLLEKQMVAANQPDANMRVIAIGRIAKMEPIPALAIPALLQTLKSDPDKQVQGAAYFTLKTMAGFTFAMEEIDKIEAFIKEKQLVPTVPENKPGK